MHFDILMALRHKCFDVAQMGHFTVHPALPDIMPKADHAKWSSTPFR
jgi:hypothetical protein